MPTGEQSKLEVQSGQGPNRPKSGKTSVKPRRRSLIDRFSPGGVYTPPAPTGTTISTSPQMAEVTPQKNNEVVSEPKAVAPKKEKPRRRSLIDRFSPGGVYIPPSSEPKKTMPEATPVKEETKPLPVKEEAKPSPVKEADEVAAVRAAYKAKQNAIARNKADKIAAQAKVVAALKAKRNQK